MHRDFGLTRFLPWQSACGDYRTKSENSRQTSDYQAVPRFFVSNPIALDPNQAKNDDNGGTIICPFVGPVAPFVQ